MSEERVSELLTSFGEILRHDMTMFLQRRANKKDKKFPLKVVGWVAGRFFLTTCPHQDGRRLRLESGSNYDVIYLDKGRVFGFRTHLFREIQTMVPLLLFGYPDEVERVELRKEPRYSTLFSADISSEGGEIIELFKGTIVNLSKSGCLMKLQQPTPWNVDEKVSISFDMPTDNCQYSLKCLIRMVKQRQGTESIGLEFQDPPDAFKNQIDVVASVAQEAI